jgi:hypothetical protein
MIIGGRGAFGFRVRSSNWVGLIVIKRRIRSSKLIKKK